MELEWLFTNGAIWTGAAPTDAVGVVDGRIVTLGDEARAARTARTTTVDLAGRTLVPGFRDGHIHVLDGGVESLSCDLTDAADMEEVLARVRAHAAAHPLGATGRGSGVGAVPSDWLLGYSYPPEVLPGGIGRAEVLDAVVDDRPVALWSGDHHMVWCNSVALAVAGIDAATADPPRGTVVRDGAGQPVGTLLEAAEDLLHPHLPERTLDQMVDGLSAGLSRMAAAGLVFGQEAATPADRVPAYHRLADAGLLTADLDLAWRLEPARWRDQVGEFKDARTEVDRGRARRRGDGVPGGRLTGRTVKVFVDGVIEAGTGALLAPYEDAAHSHGLTFWERPELEAAALALDRAGFELHLHAIGDAAVRLALDTFAHVATKNPPRTRHPVTAHTHLVHPDDLPRFGALGVTANFEPLWAQPNGVMVDLTEPRLGVARSDWQYPIGTLVRRGAPVSFGSDWPVSSLVPMEGIAIAVTRQTETGDPPGGWLPDQRITLGEALTTYTVGTARQCGDDEDTATIEVGRRADLTLLDQNLADVAPSDLATVGVAGTWREGTPVVDAR